jgi:hypothetical protein
MAKKEIFYQGLADLQVAIDDFSTTSPDYFRVTKAPTELYSGLNIFKFKGNPSLFVEEAPVYIEILDATGSPIYYEVGLDLESAEQSAVVTIHVNEDTTPGTGYIVMCATVKQSADGQLLDTSGINLRWHVPVYIDPSKRNETEIVFDELPTVNVVGTTAVFSNPDYNGSTTRYSQVDNYNLEYYNYNGTAIIVTSSLSLGQGFDANALGAEMYIDFALSGISSQNADIPTLVNSGVNVKASEITSGYIVLAEPIAEPIYNSNSKWVPSNLSISELEIIYETSGSLAVNETENSFNVVNVTFSNLTPQLGTIAKIRTYYASTGVGSYTLVNETDILNQATEFGFTPNSASISFALPTLQRNERIDFKFEFVNPYGIVSKQIIESLNNLFIGGNTYIGGDDNLLTGSLFVASATGTGVQITGKNSAAMIKSLGYVGFNNAINNTGQAGFVLYSGSISPIIGETGTSNNYSGVGLELVANSGSYFRYTTAEGGALDIRTNKFFLGSLNGTYISGSNGKLQISASNFSVSANGNITGSNMLLQGTTYAEFFANKQIIITTENSGSYFKYYRTSTSNYNKAYMVLDLSGEEGPFSSGSAAMYVRFFVNPVVPISAIITPGASGYDGNIIIETYGPAYSIGTSGAACGLTGSFGRNVLFQADITADTGIDYLSNSTNTYFTQAPKIIYVNGGMGGSYAYWDWDFNYSGIINTYFSDTTSTTAPPGLPSVTTLGKKRSNRCQITFEESDWASKSYNKIFENPAFAAATCPLPYSKLLEAAPGGRYAFAPGDNGWRLQSVTSYSGSIAPLFPNGIVLTSPNGTDYRISVDNSGVISTSVI